MLAIALVGCNDIGNENEQTPENEQTGSIEQNNEEHDTHTTPEPIHEAPSAGENAVERDDEQNGEQAGEHTEEQNSEQDEPDSANENTNTDTDIWEWGLFPFSFTAVDLHGNTVTEETLGEKQLFFVHLWGTWCPPCINEMPDLAVVVEEFNDRVGFLGLLDDFSTNPDGALRLLEAVSMPESFIDIDARLPELRDIVSLVSTGSVPTTIIVAPDGRTTEPIVGAMGMGYAEILNYLLELEQ